MKSATGWFWGNKAAGDSPPRSTGDDGNGGTSGWPVSARKFGNDTPEAKTTIGSAPTGGSNSKIWANTPGAQKSTTQETAPTNPPWGSTERKPSRNIFDDV